MHSLQLEEAHLAGLCLALAGEPTCPLNTLNLSHTSVTSIQPRLLAKVLLVLKDGELFFQAVACLREVCLERTGIERFLKI